MLATLPADAPIRSSSQDLLDRKDSAEAFARTILALDATEGAAVGVFGPWGSGKTSFVNLACTHFREEKITIIEFNPWLFSGTEQLVRQFFFELSTQLRARRLSKIGKALERYGDVFTGGSSHVRNLGVLLKLFGNLLQFRHRGIAGYRDRVRDLLKARDKPLIVVLDDVDRLSIAEIRDIFRLVRLTANFPNLIYIVVCDRIQVERALDEEGVVGREYLKKIIQLPFDLPELPNHRFRGQVFATINDILRRVDQSHLLDSETWPTVRDYIILPLIRSMRDLRQYTVAVHGTLLSVDGKVAPADLLALEAVRVFLPDVFKQMLHAVGALTLAPEWMDKHVAQAKDSDTLDTPTGLAASWKEQLDGLIEAGASDKQVVEVLIDTLFPAARSIIQMSDGEPEKHVCEKVPHQKNERLEQLKARRVAHHEVLQYYLARVASGTLLKFHDAEQVLGHMADRKS